MKKVISVLCVGLMLLVSANSVLAADNSLDIEKVAIQTIKNSQNLQTYNKMVDLTKKYYSDASSGAAAMRGLLQYQNSYSTYEQIVFLPIEAKSSMDQYTNNQQVVTNAVRLSAYQAYINLLKANYALNIQQGLMNGFDADYRTAKQQQSLGMVSSSQVRLAEITYLKSQYSYNSAQKNYDSAVMAVNNLMGADLSKQYATLQDNVNPAAQIKSLSDYTAIALASRSEVKNAQSALDADKQEYDYVKAAPTTDYDFAMQKLNYNMDSAQNNLDLAKITVQQSVTTAYKSLDSAMKIMEATKDLDDQAASDYQAAEIQYQTAQMSLQDFDNAKVTKAQADVNYKNAQLDAWLAQAMMNAACGAGYVPPSSSASGAAQSTGANKPASTKPDKPANRG
ncbi:TolC family protein [Desulfosporosinus sp. PR]|uniref:TolC family protein n=1 Tax=Candidatus Desulfosporosinus nitrosoreducens TaxID=3401928 RepID=UPI0027F2B3CE|nr:TolC family protein [Desulfosporosinus sp. PR]MDQ7093920.1 TolC family protein [Desulfosporosinus sp. PR]